MKLWTLILILILIYYLDCQRRNVDNNKKGKVNGLKGKVSNIKGKGSGHKGNGSSHKGKKSKKGNSRKGKGRKHKGNGRRHKGKGKNLNSLSIHGSESFALWIRSDSISVFFCVCPLAPFPITSSLLNQQWQDVLCRLIEEPG